MSGDFGVDPEPVSWAPVIGPMRPGESRVRTLPVLELCAHCPDAIPPLMTMAAVVDGQAHRPLCAACAAALEEVSSS